MGTLLINACNSCNGICYNCMYADSCKMYMDISPYTPATMQVECKRLALCKARHNMPEEVEGWVFEKIEDPSDGLKIKALCKRSLDEQLKHGEIKYLVIYVTGLTKALVETINYCHKNKINLVLMHYNPVTGEYEPQEVA